MISLNCFNPALFILLITTFSCNQSKEKSSINFEGVYQELTSFSDTNKRVLLKIKYLDEAAYVVKLQSAETTLTKTVAKSKNTVLNGVFKSISGELPFTFEVVTHHQGTLRIRDKTLQFEKIR